MYGSKDETNEYHGGGSGDAEQLSRGASGIAIEAITFEENKAIKYQH